MKEITAIVQPHSFARIMPAGRTGSIGDGIITTEDVGRATRIRNGETSGTVL